MWTEGAAYTEKEVVFLGHTLRERTLPCSWKVSSPFDMDGEQLMHILTVPDILIIGTVKKIDDLRRCCKSVLNLKPTKALKGLLFELVLHDEFIRQQKLDFYTIAKVSSPSAAGSYHCVPLRFHLLRWLLLQ